MLEKEIEKMEEEVRHFETKEGKEEYEKRAAEEKANLDRIKANHEMEEPYLRRYCIKNDSNYYLKEYPKSYEEELQEKKTVLAEVKGMATFATVVDVSDTFVIVRLDDNEEYRISRDEFAMYGPKYWDRVAVSVAGSIAHLAIFQVYYCNDASASVACFCFPLPYGKRLNILIPYSRFGTSDFGSLVCKTNNRVDVFCAGGEYYPTPLFLEKIRNEMKPNQLDSLQGILKDILSSIKSNRENNIRTID